jgi:serine/threonine protein kinase
MVYEVNDSAGETFAFKYMRGFFDRNKYGIEDLIEIDITSRVDHPHIIHAASIVTPRNCEIDGIALVLPLADQTFRDALHHPLITTDEKLAILFKLACALQFLHAHGILHLDIKSDNIVLQGDTPYFIDFGLSIVCDDAAEGRHSASVRVTVTHRAPEILRGSTKYNAAVDVWAFGIMVLRAFGGNDLYGVNPPVEADLLNRIVSVANNTQRFNYLLQYIRPQYREPLKDLLLKMLDINPVTRCTATDIVNHPLFDSVRTPITGSIITPPIADQYAPDHRDILKLLVKWVRDFYAVARVVTLFLAIDLFNRTDSVYRERSALDRMALAATCVWMSGKLASYNAIPVSHFISKITQTVPYITEHQIITTELEIIDTLNGVLYDVELYQAADNVDQLTSIFSAVVMSPNSQLYAHVDIPAYIRQLRIAIPNPTTNHKNVKVADFFQ